MLSPYDADLGKRDQDLPGLALLLDTEAFVSIMSLFFSDFELRNLQCTYVRYKPGTSCLAAYRLEFGKEAVEIYAKAYRPYALDKLNKAYKKPWSPGLLKPGRIFLEDYAIVVSIFPNDSKLRTLPSLFNSQTRKHLFNKLFPNCPDLWKGTVQTIRYKPERRYVAKVVNKNGAQALIKIYTNSNYHTARRNAKTFISRGPLRIAKRIGRLNYHHVIAFEFIPGRLMSEIIYQTEMGCEEATVIGAALAELHLQSPNELLCLKHETEISTLHKMADWIGFVHPELTNPVHELAENLANYLKNQPLIFRPIHGDFYANQVLLEDDIAAIIDLDRTVRSDPAADLGNFIAHLEQDALCGNISPNRVEPLKDALLRGYKAVIHYPFFTNVELYTAIGLFRLMPDPFRNREPNWAERTEKIFKRAETIMKTFKKNSLPAFQLQIADNSNKDVALNIPVTDPFGIINDPKMPFLDKAITPSEVQRHLRAFFSSSDCENGQISLQAIQVKRYKPLRRCLIEYNVKMKRLGLPSKDITLLGKARGKKPDTSTYNILKSLWNNGFGADSQDKIYVPKPIGIISEFNMLLQSKISGESSTRLIAEKGGVFLAERIAEAAYKLHQTQIPVERHHTIKDELRILHDRLSIVAEMKRNWTKRIKRLLDSCDQLSAKIPESKPCGIHRDFYSDQVIVNWPNLYIVDFDLYCEGDPGLDIGNFIGHLKEQALRMFNDPDAMADREEALEERFVELCGEHIRASVHAYTTLTLVRHIYLSTQFSDRCQFTEQLLELCEQRLRLV